MTVCLSVLTAVVHKYFVQVGIAVIIIALEIIYKSILHNDIVLRNILLTDDKNNMLLLLILKDQVIKINSKMILRQ